MRLAVSMGGDTDTMGAIAGSIAAAYYGDIPDEIYNKCWVKLPEDIRKIIEDFKEFTQRQKN